MKTPGRDNFSRIYTPLSKSMVYRHDSLLVNWKNDKDPIMITCKSFRNIKIKKKIKNSVEKKEFLNWWSL